MIHYIFYNPEDLPKAEDMDCSKEYETRVSDVYWDDKGDMIVKLEYLGTSVPRNSHTCLFPLVRDDEQSIPR